MINVTRRYPKLIASNATEQWQTYTKARQEGDDGKGFLAAYLADKHMLGQALNSSRNYASFYGKRDM